MLKGRVNASGDPVVPIILHLSKRPVRFFAIIDTGFNGSLSLPESLAQSGEWSFVGYEDYELATGEIVRQRIYIGDVTFHNTQGPVYAVTSHADDILIGTKLLRRNTLLVNFRTRTVRIT